MQFDNWRWWQVRQQVAALPPGTRLALLKTEIGHPQKAGAVYSVGLPVGQSEDWRFPPERNCAGVHVQDMGDHWDVHLDTVHPACDLTEHVRRDAPGAWRLGGAAVGGLVGATLGGGVRGLQAAAGHLRPP